MADELTLEILDEAIKQIEEMEYKTEIIGFRLNPEDYRAIKAETKYIIVMTNGKLIQQPPYKVLELVSNSDVPPGYPVPIRRNDV